MSKYCPICLGEYKDSIKTCPKDHAQLVTTKPEMFERLVDVYAADGEVEAELIISLLKDEGIFARESVSGISQIPVVSDTKFAIAVLQEDTKRAKEFLEQARRDGILPTTGAFITR